MNRSAEACLPSRKSNRGTEIPPGRKIPSHIELEEVFGLSRGTIRTALNVLKAERLITTPGRGLFVADLTDSSRS
jgi:DNA-binding GntR family transcriptional regulator